MYRIQREAMVPLFQKKTNTLEIQAVERSQCALLQDNSKSALLLPSVVPSRSCLPVPHGTGVSLSVPP